MIKNYIKIMGNTIKNINQKVIINIIKVNLKINIIVLYNIQIINI
jgi:hypothetical protein